VDFRIADASSLPWRNDEFDVILSNLMLCYVPDVEGPLGEMGRVCKAGGRLVVGLVHPYFYRTFKVDAAKGVVLTADLSQPFSFEITIGNRVGPFTYYYRPYPNYLNALVRAGFEIREVGDWFIDRDRYRAAFPHGDPVERSENVPLFTFFSCVRSKERPRG
jgi:SAM-dependent methyltransferase